MKPLIFGNRPRGWTVKVWTAYNDAHPEHRTTVLMQYINWPHWYGRKFAWEVKEARAFCKRWLNGWEPLWLKVSGNTKG